MGGPDRLRQAAAKVSGHRSPSQGGTLEGLFRLLPGPHDGHSTERSASAQAGARIFRELATIVRAGRPGRALRRRAPPSGRARDGVGWTHMHPHTNAVPPKRASGRHALSRMCQCCRAQISVKQVARLRSGSPLTLIESASCASGHAVSLLRVVSRQRPYWLPPFVLL